MEISEKEVENLIRISQHPKFLSTPIGDDKETTPNLLQMAINHPLYDSVSKEFLRDYLNEVLETLSDREKSTHYAILALMMENQNS